MQTSFTIVTTIHWYTMIYIDNPGLTSEIFVSLANTSWANLRLIQTR